MRDGTGRKEKSLLADPFHPGEGVVLEVEAGEYWESYLKRWAMPNLRKLPKAPAKAICDQRSL